MSITEPDTKEDHKNKIVRSPFEKHVLEWIHAGYGHKKISRLLRSEHGYIASPNTVKDYMKTVYRETKAQEQVQTAIVKQEIQELKIEVGQAAQGRFLSLIEKRKKIKEQVQERIDKIKESEKTLPPVCITCGGQTIKPQIEQALKGYWEMVHTLDKYIEGYTFKYELGRLLESVSVETAKIAFEIFLTLLPVDQREVAAKRFTDEIQSRIGEIIQQAMQ
jgi:hypothetical protein